MLEERGGWEAVARRRETEGEREAKTRCLLGGPAGSRRTRAKERARV